jgi:hypothetical protein
MSDQIKYIDLGKFEKLWDKIKDERIEKNMPKYNLVTFEVTKQVTQKYCVALSDDDVKEVENSDGELDPESFAEMKDAGRAFPIETEAPAETIHSVEMVEEVEEEN